MTERILNFISEIKQYNHWNIGSSKTQSHGSLMENFVEEKLNENFKDIVIIKMGSQQHPDFIILPSFIYEDIKKLNLIEINKSKNKNLSKKMIEDWENSDLNEDNLRFVRVEVKTKTKGKYILNDTFPEPDESRDEIYILIDLKNKKSFVNTSYNMANKNKLDIKNKFLTSKNLLNHFKFNIQKIWIGTGITTAGRPTYSMDESYANFNAEAKLIVNIFKKGKIDID